MLPDCAAGDVRVCDAGGKVGSQTCEATGSWGTCSAGGADSKADGRGGQPPSVGTGGSVAIGGGVTIGGFPGSAGEPPMGGEAGDDDEPSTAGEGGSAGEPSTAGEGGSAGEPSTSGEGGAPQCEPSLENCTTAVDEDCDGETPACTGALQFGHTYVSQADQILTGLAVRPDGSFAITVNGWWSDVSFGTPEGTLTNAGDWDAYVVRYDADGNGLWARGYGDGASQELEAVTFDGDGSLLVTGGFEGSYSIGGESFGPPSHNVLAKFDADGNDVWAKAFAGSEGWDVAASPGGEISLGGIIFDSTNFGGETRTLDGNINGFVAKFDASGNWVWDHQLFGWHVLVYGVAVDSAGDTIAVGRFSGDVDWGEGPVEVLGANGFIVRFDSEGALVRGQTFGSGYAFPVGVAVDAERNVVVAGNFDGNLDFGDASHSASEGMFVAKFDVQGNVLWSRDYDASTVPTGAADVAVDPFGNVLLCGYFRGSLDTPTPLSGDSDSAIIKLDPSGNFVWARAFGADYADALAIGSDGLGNAFVGGRFFDDIDFGEGTVSSSLSDIFVAKLAP